MKQERIDEIKEKIVAASNYPHEWSEGRVSIKIMAEYLEAVHPELIVELSSWSAYKDTKYAGSRLRIPGSREYKGYKLRVWYSEEDRKTHLRYGTVVDHDTTETYRQNWEVAKRIVQYEKKKEGWNLTDDIILAEDIKNWEEI